jgi:hypothetical protein
MDSSTANGKGLAGRGVLQGQFFQQLSGSGRALIFSKDAGDALRILAV